MYQTAEALYTFFGGFGIPAYVEENVPYEIDGVPLRPPYITYELKEPDWGQQTELHAQVWYRDESFAAIAAKVGEIGKAIGAGIGIPTDEGIVRLYKADGEWAQNRPMPGDYTLKCAYLRLIVEIQ